MTRRAGGLAVIWGLIGVGCSTPTSPPPPPPPPVVGPATAPVIVGITVPLSRVEAAVEIAIAATVEDAETPLDQLDYAWTTSAGSITGTGRTATWRVPAGLTAGVDVTVTLTVTDTYDAVEGMTIVKRQFVVSRTSSSFRVHDSPAETSELARKFLIDLFGNSTVGADDCLVDFADLCARWQNGRDDEREDIINHRRDYVVLSASMLQQSTRFFSLDDGLVTSAVRFIDSFQGRPPGETCANFLLTTVYVNGRWWLCQSTIDRSGPPPVCAGSRNDGGVFRIFGRGGGAS